MVASASSMVVSATMIPRASAVARCSALPYLASYPPPPHLSSTRSLVLPVKHVPGSRCTYNCMMNDHRTLNHVLESCKLNSDSKSPLKAHAQIIKLGYVVYPSIVASLLSTYLRCDHVKLGNRLLDHFLHWTPDLVRRNILIESLVKAGECDFAKKVFSKIPSPDVVTWNSMIGGYVRNGRFEDALRLFHKILNSNVEPDKFTFASAVAACARLGSLPHACWIHGLMIDKGIEFNPILSAALIDVYSKCGKIQTAKEIFDSVERNDVSVWNAMVNGLALHGMSSDAIAVVSRMETEGILPDSITFIGILTVCSHCGLLEEGLKYFNLMRDRYSIQPQIEHYGAVVDLYGRVGHLQEAYAMIKTMPVEPDIIIWRSLLSSCRIHKNPELGEIAASNISRLKSGDYVLLSNMYSSLKRWDSAAQVRESMKHKGVKKIRGKSWIELHGDVHRFKAGDRTHAETEAIYRVLEGLMKRTKLEGYKPDTDLVLMDVSEEEKEENLNYHSEKLALAYGILKTSPGTEVRIQKNLRICQDCHGWIKMVSGVLNRTVVVRDRIRFHQFEGGSCSCGDYW